MFVQREWLEARLQEGLSLEQIGRLAGRHASTVGYWLKRHGLTAAGAASYAPRGAIARIELETMAGAGLTLRQMAAQTERSVATVRYWLRKHEISRSPVSRQNSRTPADAATAARTAVMLCARHGSSEFVLEGRGSYRCKRCRQEQVSAWRRRIKRKLVEEAGGKCIACGYSECVAALQFHHVDPTTKSFSLAQRGLARSWAAVRAEAAKCLLLCANCHAEVEVGFRTLPRAA
jgi:transposase